MTAAAAQLCRQPIDVGHDLPRGRDFALMALLDEVVLHVDHDQSGLARVDGIERMQLAQTRLHAFGGGLGNRDLVHLCFLN